MKGVDASVRRFRVIAWLVGVGLIFNCAVSLPLKYGADTPGVGAVGWPIHGLLYILYVIATADLVLVRLRWPLWRGVLIAIVGTIPFLSFVAERWVSRHVEQPASVS